MVSHVFSTALSGMAVLFGFGVSTGRQNTTGSPKSATIQTSTEDSGRKGGVQEEVITDNTGQMEEVELADDGRNKYQNIGSSYENTSV